MAKVHIWLLPSRWPCIMDLDRPAGLVRSSPAAVLTAADLHQKKKELKIDRICCTAPLKPGDDLGSGLAYHFPSLKKSLLDCKV